VRAGAWALCVHGVRVRSLFRKEPLALEVVRRQAAAFLLLLRHLTEGLRPPSLGVTDVTRSRLLIPHLHITSRADEGADPSGGTRVAGRVGFARLSSLGGGHAGLRAPYLVALVGQTHEHHEQDATNCNRRKDIGGAHSG